MSSIHLVPLGMIHNIRLISDLYSRCPCITNEKPPIKQGAMDRSFLLETVRDISVVGRTRLSQVVGLGARSVQKIAKLLYEFG